VKLRVAVISELNEAEQTRVSSIETAGTNEAGAAVNRHLQWGDNSSSLGWVTDFTEVLHGFPQPLRENDTIII
jgi:hypothetical protein